MKRKKGFTLIELLAVIVILAIIAIIAIPMIRNVIEKSKRGAAIDSVYGILEAGETYYAKQLLEKKEIEVTIDLTKDTLAYKGSKPESGTLVIGEKGKMYVIAKYGAYCIEKGFDEQKPEFVNRTDCSANPIVNPNYTEPLLHGADPVLEANTNVRMLSDSISGSQGLIPVIIEDDGTVKRANLKTEWYKYEEKNSANAVILKDESIIYEEEQIIPEENIESYFVWIPKYRYQLWDLGDYNSLTSIDNSKVHTISVIFGLENTSDAVEGQCKTPTNADGTQGLAGESENCQVGDYMTHPAFLAFDSTGFWVGKFETGYEGATSTKTGEVNQADASKVIIKPNVYSWRNVSTGNMFQTCYEYKRNLESHMMKNTEWGAVAYLSQSDYGIAKKVGINQNSTFLTGYAGSNSKYNTTTGYTASTTGNITGIYDMSGGSWEVVMGLSFKENLKEDSGITNHYSDFFTNSVWDNYYDRYMTNTKTDFYNRILGDAIGEIGPFQSGNVPVSSWYKEYAGTPDTGGAWFSRSGANYIDASGITAYYRDNSSGYYSSSFRVVLTP